MPTSATPLNIRSFTDIEADSLLLFAALSAKITDLNEGSVGRTLVDAPTQAVALEEARLVSTLNEMLDKGVYRSFGFDPLPALASSGSLVLNFTATTGAVTIPIGQQFKVPNTQKIYSVTTAVAVTIGATTATVSVVSTGLGSIYNTAIGTITQMVGTVTGLNSVTVTNTGAFTTGRDAETADQMRSRFQQYFVAERRATAGAINAVAKRAQLLDSYGRVTERVVSAFVADNAAPGKADVWVYNGDPGTIASGSLLTQVTNVINGYTDGTTGIAYDGYKAAGVQVTVHAATILQVSVNTSTSVFIVSPLYDYNTVKSQVISAITILAVNPLGIGDPLYYTSVIAAARTVPGLIDATIVLNVAFTGGVITPATGQVITRVVGS